MRVRVLRLRGERKNAKMKGTAMTFDSTTVRSYNAQDVPSWITVDEGQGAHVGYIADKAEGSPMGLAFSHFRVGGAP